VWSTLPTPYPATRLYDHCSFCSIRSCVILFFNFQRKRLFRLAATYRFNDVIIPPAGYPFKNIAQQECVCRAIKKHSRSIANWKYPQISTSTKRTRAPFILMSFSRVFRYGKVAIAAEKRQTKVAEESFVSLPV
jgi:hypothetical protein